MVPNKAVSTIHPVRNGLAAVGDLKQIQTMKKIFILTAAALTVFAACSKEKDVVSEEKLPAGMVKASFYADIDQTKSTESGAVFSWTENEDVAVVAADDDTKLKFTCDNVSEGHFTGTIGEGKSFGFAISPYNAAGDMIEDSGDVLYEINFASDYNDYVPGTTNAIMVGTPGASGKFMFRHAAAAFKFTVENVPVGTAFVSVATNANITGTVSKNVLSGSGLEISNSDSGLNGKEVDLNLKYAVTAPNQTLTFYVPVPTGNYTSLTVTFFDGNHGELESKVKNGLNINLSRGDVYYTPKMTFDAVTINKGAEWSYTFESSVFNGLGTETLSGQDWTLDGQATDSGYFGYDYTKGEQFGSGKKPFSTLSFTSNFGASYGISDVVINTSGASSIDAVISVSVGGTPFVTGTEPASTASLTADATEYTFTSPDGNLKAGNVVISYVNSSEKAIYLKSITINPAAQLPQVATPTFNPAAGEVTSGTEVTISSATDGATIYYTTDGNDPTTSSTQGTSVTITATTTIKAIAVKEGMANSEIATAQYTIAGATDYSVIETSNVTLTAGTNGSAATVNDKEAIKVGTSKAGGDMTITVPSGTTKLHLHAAAWNGVNGLSLNISGATVSPSSIALTADSGIANNSPFTLTGNPEDFYFVLELSNITADTEITFTSSSAKRFVVWGVNAEAGASVTWNLESISITTPPTKTTYTAGQSFDPAGMVVTGHFVDADDNTNTKDEAVTGYTITPDGALSTSDDHVTITYQSKTTTQAITVNAASSETPSLQYTLTPASGSNNSYTGNCDIDIDGITWNLSGNSQQIPWRIGGKSLRGVNRALYSKTALNKSITSIEITHGAASSITVNSMTVIVASDADFNNVISTLTPTFAANSTVTIDRPSGKDWSNCYYKIVYNVTVSGSSNKFVEFSEAKFYGTN